MSSRLALRLRSHLLRVTTSLPHNHHHNYHSIPTIIISPSINNPSNLSDFRRTHPSDFQFRFLSTAARRTPVRPKPVDIGARARQLQTRRLWTYALTFSCIAGFIVIVLNSFQDQLVFYLTPSGAWEKYTTDPSKNKFRLGGLVLEGSVRQPSDSPEMEFVITDLLTDILVRYQGQLPDLFREGHSVVVEGFVKPFTDEMKKNKHSENSVSGKARNMKCYFAATEVLAKHDEKYMPREVAEAIEKNKKILAEAATVEEAKKA